MQRILVTGGAGFIGSHFVEMCLDKSFPKPSSLSITVVDSLTYAGNLQNLSPFFLSKQIDFHEISILDTSKLISLVKNTDCIIHFAAETHVDRSIEKPDIFIETNILGTHNLIKLATEFDKLILIVSTDEVYGSLQSGYAKETDALNPSSPYSSSKAAADLIALSYHRTFGTKVIITRCTNNYGPRQYPEKLIPTSIRNLLLGRKVGIYGDGKNIRDWIHVTDHVHGIFKALQYGKIGEIYNFGSQDEFSNIDLIRMILEIMNLHDDRIEFIEDRRGHDFRYALDTNKSKSELNWIPNHSLIRDLEPVVNWYINLFNNQKNSI